jgi:hypothetical protein
MAIGENPPDHGSASTQASPRRRRHPRAREQHGLPRCAGTLRKLKDLDARPGASAEDRWQRRMELLFERLAVRWEIAGLPLESQKELLGRFRMASAEERRWVRETLDEHMRSHHPDA